MIITDETADLEEYKMKTRIISGIVMGTIVSVIIALGFLLESTITTVCIALLATVAVFELMYNAAKINSKYTLIGAMVFVFWRTMLSLTSDMAIVISVLYFIYAVIGVLKNHKHFTLGDISISCFSPLFLSTAFVFLNYVIIARSNIYYLLLLLNFSCVCDMGAYFTGVTIGKHKLCPEISPKKTIEGAVGGIASSVVVTVILALCFSKGLLAPMLLTIPLCALGMIGDLFASAIKRSVDLKDYGDLIPGHGGILDRLDSILMISPVMGLLIALGVL